MSNEPLSTTPQAPPIFGLPQTGQPGPSGDSPLFLPVRSPCVALRATQGAIRGSWIDGRRRDEGG